MNREEAKLKKDFCKDDMCRGLMDIVNEHINKIYDDFESRTCESCKYYIGKVNLCLYVPQINGEIPKDFGCNKWGAKDD